MKVRLQESEALGILRCPEDGKELLVFNDDDINLQACEHYHWHMGSDDIDENVDENVDEEYTDEYGKEWSEILKHNYIAKVSVEEGAFYLLSVKKATEKE